MIPDNCLINISTFSVYVSVGEGGGFGKLSKLACKLSKAIKISLPKICEYIIFHWYRKINSIRKNILLTQ